MQLWLWGLRREAPKRGCVLCRAKQSGAPAVMAARRGAEGPGEPAEAAVLFCGPAAGAIRGPSAHNRLCLKGIHSLAARPSALHLCTQARTTHFHAPLYLAANGNSARGSRLSASLQQFLQRFVFFVSVKGGELRRGSSRPPHLCHQIQQKVNSPWRWSSPATPPQKPRKCASIVSKGYLPS